MPKIWESNSSAQKPYSPGSPLSFMHIPKCHGSSLIQAILEAKVRGSVVAGFDRSMFGDFEAFESLSENARRTVYLKNNLPEKADFVAAHMSFSTLSQWVPCGQLMTLVREPRARLLSLWLYWRSFPDESLEQHWGTLWSDRVRNSRRPLVEFLSEKSIACQTDNQVLRLLLYPHPLIPPADFIEGRHDDVLIRGAAECLRNFSFLNIVENPGLEAGLASWFGRPITIGKVNETASIPAPLKSPFADELNAAAWKLMGDRSRLDLKIWLWLAAKLMPRSDVSAFQSSVMTSTIVRNCRLMS